MRRSRITLSIFALALVGTLGPAAAPRSVGGLVLGELTPAVVAAAHGPDTDASASPAATSAVEPRVVTTTAVGVTYRMASGVTFMPRGSTTTFSYPGTGAKVTTAGSDFYTAPLNLPQGARITEIVWYYTDTDAVESPVFALTAYEPHSPLTEDIDAAGPTGTASGIQSMVRDLTALNVIVDNRGHSYNLLAETHATGSTVVFYGARIGYIAPATEYVAITPARVFDSRFAAFGGPIAPGSPRTLSVADAINTTTGVVTTADVVPAGARSVTYNLTITSTTGAGFLALAPGTSSAITASAINWTTTNALLANGGSMTLGSGAADRKMTIIAKNGTAQAILDITGYYIAP